MAIDSLLQERVQTMGKRENYLVAKSDLPVRTAKPSSAASDDIRLTSRRIYGMETSIMFAERGPGYHTRPHRHACEQINYIISGEIWFFVEGVGYRCRAGDIMRVPRSKIHWAWNCGSEQAVLIESHSPPLIGNNAEARKTAVPLLGSDENVEDVKYVVNEVVPMDPARVAEVESCVHGAAKTE
jgi:mannose-6-phosphate isomerase-like protein (cupin superfamily)